MRRQFPVCLIQIELKEILSVSESGGLNEFFKTHDAVQVGLNMFQRVFAVL